MILLPPMRASFTVMKGYFFSKSLTRGPAHLKIGRSVVRYFALSLGAGHEKFLSRSTREGLSFHQELFITRAGNGWGEYRKCKKAETQSFHYRLKTISLAG